MYLFNVYTLCALHSTCPVGLGPKYIHSACDLFSTYTVLLYTVYVAVKPG